MPAAPLALIALAAPVAAYGPVAPAPAKPKVAAIASAKDACVDQRARNERAIVVCAPHPDGYRINPDLMEAKREARDQSIRLRPPEAYKDATACNSIGPFGCTGTPAINLVAVGLVAAEMIKRAATGGNVGQMFVTNPQKSEYELYLEAKARREAKEKAEAAAALAKRATAAAAATLKPSATAGAP